MSPCLLTAYEPMWCDPDGRLHAQQPGQALPKGWSRKVDGLGGLILMQVDDLIVSGAGTCFQKIKQELRQSSPLADG